MTDRSPTANNTAKIIPIIQVATANHSFRLSCAYRLYTGYAFSAGCGTEQQVQKSCQHQHCCSRAHAEASPSEQSAELVNHQAYPIGKHVLIQDGEPGPSPIVHLLCEGADSRQTGRIQQIEQQEGESSQGAPAEKGVLLFVNF